MYLKITDLKVAYGNIEVIHGINLDIKKGEIVTILGANGAGKSTTLATISGLIKPSFGEIVFKNEVISNLRSHEIVLRGITQSPEGRRVFATLTVAENLLMGAFSKKSRKKIQKRTEWVFELFPRLLERKRQLAGTLSGGEQQMLAIGRALMAEPEVLLLDEPSLGLAPLFVKFIFQTIKSINELGVTIVLVEQNAAAALKLADRGYVLDVGQIALSDLAKNLLNNPDVQKAYLGADL